MARLEADDDGVDGMVVDVLVSQAGKEQGIAVGVAMARAPARQGRAPAGGLVATQSREALLPWYASSVARQLVARQKVAAHAEEEGEGWRRRLRNG